MILHIINVTTRKKFFFNTNMNATAKLVTLVKPSDTYLQKKIYRGSLNHGDKQKNISTFNVMIRSSIVE